MTSSRWNLISNHGAVVLLLAANSDCTMREIAEEIGITERQVARALRDLREAGMVGSVRRGRRNSYYLDLKGRLRREAFEHITVERFVRLMAKPRARGGND